MPMIWQNRYLTVGAVDFGLAAPDPASGFVQADPERNLDIIALASGISVAQLPPDITATRITIAGGTNIAVPNEKADQLRNLMPGTVLNISENYTLSTGRVWVNVIVVKPFRTTLHLVQTGADGIPTEQYFTYSGFEGVLLGRPV